MPCLYGFSISCEVDPGRGKKGPCSPMKAVPTEEQPGPLRNKARKKGTPWAWVEGPAG